MLEVMSDTSCGEQAAHSRGACVGVCCSNLSGGDDVRRAVRMLRDDCVQYRVHISRMTNVCVRDVHVHFVGVIIVTYVRDTGEGTVIYLWIY